ncbi:hypothetical protein HBH99_220560 [Parastagonospora nodorum]|nr:hypothetical protein HBI05_239010 [Parastagonospora nodorum]KAH4374697.1 hypothetical protein HBH99_220560 [Parastagonospora nodorum]KAH5088983.1 hypothetical protein HBH72_236630 [Parastagonospora nodorum]KAH5098055.1 hypothetical protein HBH71_243750 [Parastagonospora nodorum]KAH5390727.1 hypothetical protein HBI32_242950 [Parastagonospora nodorum]
MLTLLKTTQAAKNVQQNANTLSCQSNTASTTSTNTISTVRQTNAVEIPTPPRRPTSCYAATADEGHDGTSCSDSTGRTDRTDGRERGICKQATLKKVAEAKTLFTDPKVPLERKPNHPIAVWREPFMSAWRLVKLGDAFILTQARKPLNPSLVTSALNRFHGN